MKRAGLILLTGLMLISLSGCYRLKATMNIDKDGFVDFDYYYAVNESLAGNNELEDIQLKLTDQDDGWTREEYNKDGYVGYEMSRKNIELDNYENYMNSDVFSIRKVGWKYVLDVDLKDFSDELTSNNGSALSAYGGYAKFELNLPYRVKKSNASKVSSDGRKLTWNLLDMKDGEKIHAEFTLYNPDLVRAAIIGGLLLIGALVIWILVMVKKKREKAYQEYVDNNIPEIVDMQAYNEQNYHED